jgi:hypothetical protein
MGNEATCRVSIGGESAEAKVLLETGELIVRGALKARIPFRDVKDVVADDGVLRLRWNGREVSIQLGADAAKWAAKIVNPKSVIDKLGVKPGQMVSIAGSLDPAFIAGLEKHGADVSSRVRKGSAVIFLAANRASDLQQLESLRDSLDAAGAIWVIRPKGVAHISESDVMAAGKAAGLVDVKVVRFSDTHTAEKLVIPLAKRPSPKRDTKAFRKRG